MINWANTRQQAVDDARRDTPHANVHIYYYVEVNRVRDAMNGKVRVANKVLPRTNPDFVSYSSYDEQNGDIEKNFAEVLEYIQAQLSPNRGFSASASSSASTACRCSATARRHRTSWRAASCVPV